MPQYVDLRIDARWVVPIIPAGALASHSVLIDGGSIVAVLPSDEVAGAYIARETLSLPDHALLPGLVNAHTHAAMTLFRGIADDLPLKAWLEDQIWPREMRHLSEEFVHDGTLLATAEMLKGGVTCCNDQYFFADAAARAYQASGMRAMIGLAVVDFPTDYAADAADYLRVGLLARDTWRHEPLLSFSLAPHAPYTVADASWEQIVVYARQLDLPIQTHLLETRDERGQSVAQHGIGPLQRLHRLGVTGPGFIAVHGVFLDAKRYRIDGGAGVPRRALPDVKSALASGIAPIAELRRHGINVALGTDGAASNNRLDVFGEARLAALISKGATGDAASLPAADVLRMATLGGAQALGLDGAIGSLERGKQADIIAVDMGGIDHQPCYEPISHLIHVTGRSEVSDAWVAGKRVLASGQLTRLDTQALAARARFWHDRLQ